MSAEIQPPPSRPAEAVQTLGDVLYGIEFKPRISETEWIALIRAIAGGDTGALGDVYMMTHGIVFTLIVRITGSRQIAEELTVEVFHEVWTSARNYDPANETVVAWIMNLARAHAISRQRTARPEDRAQLCAAVKELAPEERQAIESTFHSGATIAEAAATEAQLPAIVEARISSALDKLRRVLRLEDPRR